MRQRRLRRRGLTLIETVLTFSIGMLILLAVFMIMQSQYNHTEAGREAIQEATLARNILTRVGDYIGNSLSSVDPHYLPTNILPNNANQGVKPVSGAAQSAIAAATNLGIQLDSSMQQASDGSGTNGASGTPGTSGATGTTGGMTATSKTGVTSTTKTGAGASGSGMAGASGASAGTNSSSSNSSTSSANASTSTGTTPLPFNLGVKGDAKWLVISSSRVPGTLLGNPTSMGAIDPSVISSDLRSVSIYFVEGSGLARREMAAVTSDDAPTDEPNFSNSDKDVFAPQVQDVLFEYFDGTSWQTTWDGGQLGGNDGNTPIGPPAAIGITITLKSNRRANDEGQPDLRKYKHVVELPTTNAFTQSLQQGSSSSSSLSGNTLIQALQNGQQIPPANQSQSQSGTGSSSSSSSTTGQ
jgi:hypothetical protein